MTLDEAIKHCEEVVEEAKRTPCIKGGLVEKCGKEHEELAEWLRELKSLREQRPQGEWFYNDYGNGCGNWHCSICDHMPYYAAKYMRFLNYCPNCGADMRGGRE